MTKMSTSKYLLAFGFFSTIALIYMSGCGGKDPPPARAEPEMVVEQTQEDAARQIRVHDFLVSLEDRELKDYTLEEFRIDTDESEDESEEEESDESAEDGDESS